MKTIFSEWKSYRQQVLPPDCSVTQAQETKRAFYAGSSSMFYLMVGLPDDSDEPSEQDLAAMDRVKAEIAEYYLRMKEGKE